MSDCTALFIFLYMYESFRTATSDNEWTRLQAVIEWKGMSINYFARYIGLSNSFFLYAIKHKYEYAGDAMQFTPGLADLAERIVRVCPEINKKWLITGEGKMFCEGYDFS